MKCFLSHSSSDKGHYVSIVAKKLGPNVEYDELTFEEGMGNLEEILSAMNRSDVFVLFISNSSLESNWVKEEISEAKKLIDRGDLKRFYPIIIDRSITHKDPRIPGWVRNTYNLKPISRPTISAKRIRERLVEASWISHPMLKERDQIFVGRNSHISDFEQRFDDFNKRQPLAVFASGLYEIGRKSTMRYALRKANIARETYEPIRIDLSLEDSLDGLIMKIYDLGLTPDADVLNLMDRTVDEKTALCASLLNDVFYSDELLLIEDHYCVVRYSQDIAPWFLSVIDQLDRNTLCICVASAAKAAKYKYIRDDRFYFMEIPELSRSETNGLFRRYTEHLKLDLTRVDFENFTPLLKGFPEQVTYAANLIQELGSEGAFSKADEIVSFSTFKAGIFIKKYEDDEEVLNFLRFLSSFEFVSVDFIANAERAVGADICNMLDRFVVDSVCEPIGSTGQYFRVNEVIRDAIMRDRAKLPDKYTDFLRSFAKKFSQDFDAEYYDVSEYYIAIREALASNVSLPEGLLIPAHFLKSMKELYSAGRHREVISLADRVLLRSDYYDEHTRHDILYYLCQSLARLRDSRFTEEVQSIDGAEHDFLFGFYYRLKGSYERAIPRYERAMESRRTEQRARRELVHVLTTIEAYDEALSYAKENFEKYPSNPFFAQAYFDCLFHTSADPATVDTLQEILDALSQARGARANEMYDTLAAKFEYRFGDQRKSFEMVQAAIKKYPGVVYPVLAALDMSINEMDPEGISVCIKTLEKSQLGLGHHLAVNKGRVVFTALSGDKARATRMVKNEMAQLSGRAAERLLSKIEAV